MSDYSSDPGGDRYVEQSSTNIVSRLLGSIVGALFGLLLLLAAPALLFWNESRAVEASRGLAEAGRAVVEAKPSPIDPAQDGRLVHLAGPLLTRAPLSDRAMGLTLPDTVYISRKVEMYQWKENKETRTTNQLGGGQTSQTVITYAKVWSDSPISSSGFRGNHDNPEMPLRSATFTAPNRMIGDRTLTPDFTQALGELSPAAPPQPAPDGFRRSGERLYSGSDPARPEIGDVRIAFTSLPAGGEVSVIGAQKGSTIAPFAARSGYGINLMAQGTVSAGQMLADQGSQEAVLTWGLRIAGFICFVVALALLGAPIATLAGVLPFLGSLVEGGIILFAVLLAIPLTLLTIGLTWIAVRPLLGLGLLAAAALAVVAFVRLRRRRAPSLAKAAPLGA